jgi:phosphoglycolate phosphatase
MLSVSGDGCYHLPRHLKANVSRKAHRGGLITAEDSWMHVLLFDIDGTLINAGGAGQSAMEQAVAREFGETRAVDGIHTAGRTDRAIGRDLFDYYSIPATDANWSRYLQTYFSLLPGSLNQCPGAILPGVAALMEQLSHHDEVFLGLLTGNFAVGARLKLEHYGLYHHFRTGGFGDLHLHRDDVARDALAAVKEQLPGVAAEQIWVIGDTPADVQCGRAIGANVVAVATGIFTSSQLAEHRPDILLEDLTLSDKWVRQLKLL